MIKKLKKFIILRFIIFWLFNNLYHISVYRITINFKNFIIFVLSYFKYDKVIFMLANGGHFSHLHREKYLVTTWVSTIHKFIKLCYSQIYTNSLEKRMWITGPVCIVKFLIWTNFRDLYHIFIFFKIFIIFRFIIFSRKSDSLSYTVYHISSFKIW